MQLCNFTQQNLDCLTPILKCTVFIVVINIHIKTLNSASSANVKAINAKGYLNITRLHPYKYVGRWNKNLKISILLCDV